MKETAKILGWRTEERQHHGEDATWGMVDLAVKAFMDKYPAGMTEYLRQNHEMRTRYQLAIDPEMKKVNWRNTLSFPVCKNPLTGDEDCLLPVLKRLMPDLLRDQKLYQQFMKRYPQFMVPEKY